MPSSPAGAGSEVRGIWATSLAQQVAHFYERPPVPPLCGARDHPWLPEKGQRRCKECAEKLAALKAGVG